MVFSTFLFQLREGVGASWPLTTVSAVVLAISARVTRERDAQADLRLWRDACVALLAPLLLPVWSTLTSAAEKNRHATFPWASSVLFLLALLAIVLALRVLYRGRATWLLFLPVTISVLVACFLGLFVGVMQIVDDWV